MTVLPQRKKNRLQNYDYSQNGAYFITICAKDHKKIFGEITPETTTENVGAISNRPSYTHTLSEIGNAVETALSHLDKRIIIDKYVIMPNHVHLIIIIDNSGRTEFAPTISSIVRYIKSYVTKQAGFSPWQKSFHDHIIRNESNYLKIAEYIENNPITWNDDCFYVY